MDSSNHLDNSEHKTKKDDHYFGALYLGTVAVASIAVGFSMALAIAKKKDPNFFLKGMAQSKPSAESGGSLAMRALGWGTVWAVSGVSLFSLAVWKAVGAHSLEEFRLKCGSVLPKLTPPPESSGRSDFKSVRELLQYLIDEDKKKVK